MPNFYDENPELMRDYQNLLEELMSKSEAQQFNDRYFSRDLAPRSFVSLALKQLKDQTQMTGGDAEKVQIFIDRVRREINNYDNKYNAAAAFAVASSSAPPAEKKEKKFLGIFPLGSKKSSSAPQVSTFPEEHIPFLKRHPEVIAKYKELAGKYDATLVSDFENQYYKLSPEMTSTQFQRAIKHLSDYCTLNRKDRTELNQFIDDVAQLKGQDSVEMVRKAKP